MIYAKPYLPLSDQADLLLKRGLVADRDHLIEQLSVVGYYRLVGYWYPFRQNDPANPHGKLDEFEPGTTFDQVWNRYCFDRQLRLLVMDGIERLEVFLRAQLAHRHAERHGPFGYAVNPATLPNLRADQHARFRDDLQNQLWRSPEGFVTHFRNVYTSHHRDLPIWMASELLTFGAMYTFYRGCESAIQQTVAARLGIHDTVLYSWLETLNVVRNVCGHHARLWNRVLSVKPRIPERDPLWNLPVPIPNDRVFAILSICRYSLRIIAPKSQWTERLNELLEAYPAIPRAGLGLIPDWDKHPLWSNP